MVESWSMPLKAVIFDLDHTLIRSHIDFVEMRTGIVNYLKQNLSIQPDLTKSTYEMTLQAVKFVEERGLREKIPSLLQDLNEIMTDVEMKCVSNAEVIDGAFQTIKRLKGAGMKIGILTRSCRKYADQTLKTTGLSELIDEVAARDDGEKPKPDPSQVYWLMERMRVGSNSVIMVGDHPIDSLCAKNAGIGFVGVLTGSWGKEQVEKLGSTVVPSVKELPEILGV